MCVPRFEQDTSGCQNVAAVAVWIANIAFILALIFIQLFFRRLLFVIAMLCASTPVAAFNRVEQVI
eukprot:COSAG01_NODE_62455_length_284_cov_1.286486_1_plen_65_part_01